LVWKMQALLSRQNLHSKLTDPVWLNSTVAFPPNKFFKANM
jgi:hypothetical protein